MRSTGTMRRLSLHIFRRTTLSFAAVLAVLTAIVWMTQALRRFDLVTAKGQAIVTYLGMTMLALPFLVSVVAPFALVIAMILVLNAMHADSELVAANAAGFSHRDLLKPFLALGLVVALLVGWIGFYSGPQALQALRDLTNQVRADIVANVVQPGRFADIDDSLTFHIRNRGGDGSLEGLFIYDARDPAFVYTYSAERGRVVEAVGRTLVVMEKGTVERTRRIDHSSTFVAFGSYAFDLSELQPAAEAVPYKPNERTITELLATPAGDAYRSSREGQWRAEIHNRVAAVAYPVIMVLAAFLFLGFPKTTRTGRALAVFGALVIAALCRIAGFAVSGVASADARFVPVVYAVPALLLAVTGISVAFGIQPFVPAWLAHRLAAVGDAVGSLVRRVAGRGGVAS